SESKWKWTAIEYKGTTVNYDSLLMDLHYRRTELKSKVYRAIIKPPEREDLWEECRQIYQDYDNPNREEDAKAFYETNKEEMEKGAVLIWQESQNVCIRYPYI